MWSDILKTEIMSRLCGVAPSRLEMMSRLCGVASSRLEMMSRLCGVASSRLEMMSRLCGVASSRLEMIVISTLPVLSTMVDNYTGSQRPPRDLVSKATGFIMDTRISCHMKQYFLNHTRNMDETPLWFDMPGEITVTCTGERSVPFRKTGDDKGRYTLVLSAITDGRKLKVFVVFKGVRPMAELSTLGPGYTFLCIALCRELPFIFLV